MANSYVLCNRHTSFLKSHIDIFIRICHKLAITYQNRIPIFFTIMRAIWRTTLY